MDFKFVQVGTEECPVRNLHGIIVKSDDYQMLFEKGPSLATNLGVNLLDIKKLKQALLLNKMEFSEVVVEVFELWVGGEGSQATLDKLLSALKSSGLNLAADLIQTEFQIQNSIITELKYYINRTLITRSSLNKERLINQLAASDDIFIFSRISLPALNNILENETPAHSTKLIGDKTIQKCVVLDHRSHYEKICKLTKRSVHLIHVEEDKWTHLKSTGNFTTMQALTDKDQMRWTEEQFISDVQRQLGNHPVCIADSPGMGKTTLLHSFCQRLRQKYPNRVVWLVGMNKFVTIFKENGGKSGAQDMRQIESIVESTCFSLFGSKSSQKSLISAKLQSNDLEIELMLDGLDEVVSSKVELAFEVLGHLQKYSSIRLWVSTRPHLLQELESCLNVFGYNLQPFNENDQINFLKRFWSSESHSLDHTRLETFAVTCLSELKLKLSKKDEDIAGIPLQCLLIGEVYKDQALEHSALEDPNTSGIIHVGSLIELYHGLVKKQTKKYMENYGESRLTHNEIDLQHIKLSIQLIFPQTFYNQSSLYQQSISFEELFKVGLLEKSSTFLEPKFIHRTIGEYFVACFISKILKNAAEGLLPHLHNQILSHVLFQCREMELDLSTNLAAYTVQSFYFVNTEICYFVNILIGEGPFSYDFEVREENLKKAIHASVYADLFNIFNAIINPRNNTESLRSFVFNENFLLLTIRCASARFFQTVFGADFGDLDDEIKSHSLLLAVKSGNVSICQHLLNKENLRKMLKPPFLENVNLILHECVQNSLGNSNIEVQDKIELLNIISNINRDLLEERDSSLQTPILCRDIHSRILTELITSFKVNVSVEDYCKNNIFHIHHAQCDILFDTVPYEIIKVLLQKKNYLKHTPLLTLIHNNDPPSVATLTKFKNHKANFNCKTNEGYSLLAVSIMKGRCSETILKLVDCGADLKWKKGFKRKSLLHYAGQYGNVDAMLCLVKEFKMNLNRNDLSFKSAIDYLVESFKEHGHSLNYVQFNNIIQLAPKVDIKFDSRTKEIVLLKSVEFMNVSAVDYLLNDGITGNLIENYDGNLMQAWKSKCEMVERWARCFKFEAGSKILQSLIRSKFIDSGEDVFYVNLGHFMTSVLHIAVQFGNLESVEFLIEYGHFVNPKDSEGRTPLELFDWSTLGKESSLEKVKYLVSKGAHIKVLENTKPLHTVGKNGTIESLNYLLELGLNINAEDKFGRTPLSLCFADNDKPRGWKKAELIISKESRVTFADIKRFLKSVAKLRPSNFNELGLSSLYQMMEQANKTQFGRYTKGPEFGALNYDYFTEEMKNYLLQSAVENEDIDELRLYLNLGMKVDSRDNLGRTMLHTIIKDETGSSDKQIIELLLSNGANPNALDIYGRNVLHTAAKRGNCDILEYFLEQGLGKPNGVDLDGRTPIHTLVKNSSDPLTSFTIDQLLLNGADINIEDKKGRNVLHLAAQRSNQDLVKYFVYKGFNINSVDKDGNTPLHYTLNGDSPDHLKFKVIQFLLENGADKSIKNHSGFTPLVLAKRFDAGFVIQKLLQQ